jgi:predicted nucleic acid-binding protein
VSLGLNRKVQLYVSEPILAEYEQVLLYPRLKFSLQQVDRFMALIRRAGVLVGPAHLVSESTHDADNRFLECAVDPRAASPRSGMISNRQPGIKIVLNAAAWFGT